MILFNCDYSEGAHENILRRLAETNMEQTPGYEDDPYCNEARALISKLCQRDDADIHFLIGGTQTNFTIISAALRPHQCVLCADTAHINVHESGAIEACGHKVSALPTPDGKLTAQQIDEAWHAHWDDDTHEHMAQPKMVYISHPTELGTVYSRRELEDLSAICHKRNLYLYMDGARLGYGLQSEENDLDLPTIASLCDAFYIGGTKNGALFGEALVLLNDDFKEDFRYILKQKGGRLAKGRLLGIQFIELLKDGLYFELAAHADRLAVMLRDACLKLGLTTPFYTGTNQQFITIPDSILEALKNQYGFSWLRREDSEHTTVRFCTSWATREEDIRQLINDLTQLCQDSPQS